MVALSKTQHILCHRFLYNFQNHNKYVQQSYLSTYYTLSYVGLLQLISNTVKLWKRTFFSIYKVIQL